MMSLRALRPVKAAQVGHSPAERGLVRRLDTFLLTFGCISQSMFLCNLLYVCCGLLTFIVIKYITFVEKHASLII
jgi:hypothetical protein